MIAKFNQYTHPLGHINITARGETDAAKLSVAHDFLSAINIHAGEHFADKNIVDVGPGSWDSPNNERIIAHLSFHIKTQLYEFTGIVVTDEGTVYGFYPVGDVVHVELEKPVRWFIYGWNAATEWWSCEAHRRESSLWSTRQLIRVCLCGVGIVVVGPLLLIVEYYGGTGSAFWACVLLMFVFSAAAGYIEMRKPKDEG